MYRRITEINKEKRDPKNYLQRLTVVYEKLDRTARQIDSKLKLLNKMERVVTKNLKEYAEKMTSLEDTFFTLYHNIKKNQWKYVQDPEDWWEDYRELKKMYKEENNEKND